MTYDEKYSLIVKAVNDAKKFSTDVNNVDVPVNGNVGLWNVSVDDITKILQQIEREGVLRIKKLPKPPLTTDVHFIVSVNETFDGWVKKYLTIEGIQKLKQEQRTDAIAQAELQIYYTPAREILINQLFLLHKTSFATENDMVFDYLFHHPNENFTKRDLETRISTKINKSFHKIVENLGFSGDIKKLFFVVSKDAILFRNPVTKSDMEQLGILRITF